MYLYASLGFAYDFFMRYGWQQFIDLTTGMAITILHTNYNATTREYRCAYGLKTITVTIFVIFIYERKKFQIG
jgi:hypothetical protein